MVESTTSQNDSEARETALDKQREKEQQDLLNQYAPVPMGLFLDRQDGRLSYRDVCVYCYLLAKAKKDGNHELWWGEKHLSDMTGIDQRELRKSIGKLLKCGHIKRQRRMGNTSKTFCQTYVERVHNGTWVVVKGRKVKFYPKDEWQPERSHDTFSERPRSSRIDGRQPQPEAALSS